MRDINKNEKEMLSEVREEMTKMGCWYETCGISHLPIYSGDEVYLILVGSSCLYNVCEDYHYSDYPMFGFPIKGKYNEYGGLESETIEIKEYFLDFIKEKTFYWKDSSNIYNFSSIDDFLQDVENLYLLDEKYVLPDEIEKTFFRKWFIHKELYDILMKSFSDKIVNDMKSSILSAMEKTLSKRDKEEYFAKNIPDYEKSLEDLNVLINGIMLKDNNSIITYIGNHIISTDDFEIYIEDILTSVLFTCLMNKIRNSFIGIISRGSQNDELNLHRTIAEWVINFCNKKET